MLRISLDTKATVKIGPFSLAGYSRQGEEASDHDFQPETKLIPFGVLMPQSGDTHLWPARELFDRSLELDRKGGERLAFCGDYQRHVGFRPASVAGAGS